LCVWGWGWWDGGMTCVCVRVCVCEKRHEKDVCREQGVVQTCMIFINQQELQCTICNMNSYLR
jgi:hypothetical protein